MKFNEESMRNRGWSEEEIENAKKIIKRAPENKHKTHKHLEKAMYWILFIIIILIGIGGALMVSPLLLFLRPTQGYVLIGIIGLVFGFFAGLVVKDIEDLEKKHHLAISIVIPITAITSSLIMSKQVTITAKVLERSVETHPFTLGLIFSICLLLPYSIFIYLEKRKKK